MRTQNVNSQLFIIWLNLQSTCELGITKSLKFNDNAVLPVSTQSSTFSNSHDKMIRRIKQINLKQTNNSN